MAEEHRKVAERARAPSSASAPIPHQLALNTATTPAFSSPPAFVEPYVAPASKNTDDGITIQSASRTHEPPVDFYFFPIPTWLRYDSAKPIEFGILLNLVFAVASTFTAANLYYCQPLLIQLSDSFGVSHGKVSRVPTLVQAGYATGLLLISPTGDLVRRRPLLLLLVASSTLLTLGLALTRSFSAFAALSFLTGLASVAPQVLIPLAADLAPPHRRAQAIATVFSGLLVGVLLARVLAGVIAQFTTWRAVYYLAAGAQAVVILALWAALPDCPQKDAGVGYFGVLASTARLAVTEPRLVQACIVMLASSACFANFWVTLTFLLGGPPYNFSTLGIGLFGLVGLFGAALGPLVGRTIDALVPWHATFAATVGLLAMHAIYTGAAGVHIAAVVVVCLGLDLADQVQQVSLTTAVFAISHAMRARLNAVLILSIFIGQVTGTAVGTRVFVRYGWRAAAALSLGWTALQVGVLLARGPHCARYTWVGYEGGWAWRRDADADSRVGIGTDAEADRERKAEAEAVEAGADVEKGDRKAQAV